MPPLVLDLTRLVPGPLAVQMLQRMGFRAMRISAPGGDMLQRVAPEIYQALQADKESRTLDLKTSEGQEQLLQLRSEEHTSELQSRRDLVCRLLLEKKKKKK